MRAVAIDDDPRMHRLLGQMLKLTNAGVDLVATATSVAGGVAVIEREAPDLLFLDIELGDGTGFDLLEQIDAGRYLIIFISGHSQYGRLALTFEALDYLDKPLKSTDLAEALLKARRRFAQRNADERLKDLTVALQNFRNTQLPTRLTISNSEGIFFVPVADILRLSTSDGLVTVHCADGRKFHKTARLVTYEQQFSEYPHFMLVHKSNLVNLRRVKALVTGPYLIMEDGTEVVLTAQKARQVRGALEAL
ncbi:LytR/AlgR family response regulator transcription factor [Neolewinella antarctica]|uniref:Two-component system LytT family response regulator n=1 Tax=Neolewinella antarctica TaxID=442734 RepID=A0ABX0XE78_9BACT|nr:LytTR family DNA-binding domain-containing protein [Neolewinella antarctica]NJC27626.1 two-component system LytT family response regulator [Neolewinella antarctica]